MNTPPTKLEFVFDLWYKDAWVGMVQGETPAAARKMAVDGFPSLDSRLFLLMPYYGIKTTDDTYHALTGRMPHHGNVHKSVGGELSPEAHIRRVTAGEG